MIDIIAAIDTFKAEKIKVYPVHTNRASALGDPCERRLVLERTDWNKKAAYDLRLQYIFDEGNHQEKAIKRDLADAGIDVIGQQRPVEWKEHNITGHMDGFVLVDDVQIPLEVKTSSPFTWVKIDTYEDLMRLSRSRPWLAKWSAQMQIYLLLAEYEEGIILIKNKTSGQFKQIDVSLDYNYAEALIQKADRIESHVKNGTRPDFVQDQSLCLDCPLAHVCMPPLDYGDELEIVTDAEIIEMLERRMVLRPAKKEYDDLDKVVKAALGERKNALVGNYRATTKSYTRKGYTVKEAKVTRWEFEKIEEASS